LRGYRVPRRASLHVGSGRTLREPRPTLDRIH
jgi:hypothetical protein